ncbi:hypothetical protein [Gluconacetobacter diazotrophicus]|nr:hypothetical protein [Gluconacetobacter diazotrophicus]
MDDAIHIIRAINAANVVIPTLRAMLLLGASVFVTTLYVLGAVR